MCPSLEQVRHRLVFCSRAPYVPIRGSLYILARIVPSAEMFYSAPRLCPGNVEFDMVEVGKLCRNVTIKQRRTSVVEFVYIFQFTTLRVN